MTLLQVSPQGHLTFRGPFTQTVTSVLNLTNPTTEKLCFKVKTTAPRRYCVRPNSGFIEPGEQLDVSIMLQPFQYDPNERNNHKFMVQAMVMPENGESLPMEQVWRGADASEISDTKLKCQFELPPEVELAPAEEPKVMPMDQTYNTIEKPVAAAPAPTAAPAPAATPKAPASNDRLVALTDENNSLKRRIAELGHRQPAVEQQQSAPQAAYLILCIILGWLIAKYII